MTAQAIPYITLLGFLFGTTLIASRFGVDQFPPATFIGLRLTLAGLGFLAVYLLAGRRHPLPTDRRLLKHAAVMGIFGTAVPMLTIVSSLQYLSSGIASVLITTGPAVIVLLAHFTLPDESLNRRKAAGVALALSGAVLLAASGETGLTNNTQTNPLGYLLIFTAIILGNGMTVYARKYLSDYDSFDVSGVSMGVAALAVMPLSFVFLGLDFHAVTSGGFVALFWAALIGTFAGTLLTFYNLKRFGATASAMTAYIMPIVAGIGGVVVLHERVTAVMLAGMAIIILGIVVLQSPRRQSKNLAQTI
ncbi:MAG: DMT family transporter [Chloroflexi bacterium]|nr:DMT family transporter [Chloroflexota bacterium]